MVRNGLPPLCSFNCFDLIERVRWLWLRESAGSFHHADFLFVNCCVIRFVLVSALRVPRLRDGKSQNRNQFRKSPRMIFGCPFVVSCFLIAVVLWACSLVWGFDKSDNEIIAFFSPNLLLRKKQADALQEALSFKLCLGFRVRSYSNFLTCSFCQCKFKESSPTDQSQLRIVEF